MAIDIKIKKSVVKNVVGNQLPLELQHGTFYKYAITMENGDSGEYLSKSNEQDKFVVGQETDYEVHINPTYPNSPRIKPHYVQKSGGGFSGGGSKGGYSDEDKARMARSVAIKSSAIYHQSRSTSRDNVVADADFFCTYIVDGIVKPSSNDKMPF